MLLVLAMLVGAIVPAQTAVNTRLRVAVGAPIAAAMLSFAVAVVTATVLCGVSTSTLIPDITPAFSEPWWIWLGGFMGVMFIAGNIVLFPQLGPVQTVIMPILGQVIMGLLVDQFGLFSSPKVDVSAVRMLGALTVVLGVAMVLEVFRTPASHAKATGAKLWGLRGFGVVMGMGSATQTAVNGRLGQVLGSPLQASQVQLVVGLIALSVLVLSVRTERRAIMAGVRPGPWWMWLGGVLGAFFVYGGASIAPILGTGTTVIASLTGTIVCGQVLESLGLGTGRRAAPTPYRVTGLATVLLGVVLVRLF